jgi:hypothetical protein
MERIISKTKEVNKEWTLYFRLISLLLNVKASEFAVEFINLTLLAIPVYSLTELFTIIAFTYWNLNALRNKHVEIEDNNLLPVILKNKHQYLNVL